MTDRELNSRVRTAIERSAPNDIDDVLSRCELRKGNVIDMTTKKYNNRRTPLLRSLVAACLVLAVLGGSFFTQAFAVASTVSLDVNPSIELTVNKNERVLSCTGLNEDAAIVLSDYADGKDLKGVTLKVAVNALVGSMLNHGYLEDLSSAILISVEDKDSQRALRLQQELTASVDSTLLERSSQAAILTQSVARDSSLTQQAKANNISTGKAALVKEVIANNAALKDDDATRAALAALSVEELRDLSRRSDVPHLPLDKSQVASDTVAYAGLADAAPLKYVVDPEFDELVPYYEVEIYYNGREYEYAVDAFTGDILSGPGNVLNGQSAPGITASALPSPGSRKLSEEEAFERAAEDFASRYPELSGSEILRWRADYDWDDHFTLSAHYDVEFWVNGREFEYEIDASTGAVLKWDSDYEDHEKRNDASGPSQTPAADGAIDRAQAKAAALAHAGLSEKDIYDLELELDRKKGVLVYEIDFKANGMEYEFKIDAASGEVIKYHSEWDD